MEMFHAFGFSERVLKEACWINETTFWKPDESEPENIVRSGRVQDVEDGLSEFPHVVLNQARVHDFYLDVMRNSPAKLEPHYARRCSISGCDPAARPGDHAVTARLERLDAAHQGRSRRSRRATWLAATARAAPCAPRSGASCTAIPPTTPGA